VRFESFNGRLRDECLNVEWFTSLDEAREKLTNWRDHYNHHRPHSALDNRAPAVFAALHGIRPTLRPLSSEYGKRRTASRVRVAGCRRP
jgi:transposase InsO family protein